MNIDTLRLIKLLMKSLMKNQITRQSKISIKKHKTFLGDVQMQVHVGHP